MVAPIECRWGDMDFAAQYTETNGYLWNGFFTKSAMLAQTRLKKFSIAHQNTNPNLFIIHLLYRMDLTTPNLAHRFWQTLSGQNKFCRWR